MTSLREACAHARVRFAKYTEIHLAKDTAEGREKAQSNQQMVDMCDQALQSARETPDVSFQWRVKPWMLRCFGLEIAIDGVERNHRFLEEALELVQACGCTASEAHKLVDYVFGRPIGEPMQEAGGVMVTLAALCLAHALDMHAAGDVELARCWDNIDKIRVKQAAKPKHGPLPGPSALPTVQLCRHGNPLGRCRHQLIRGCADWAAARGQSWADEVHGDQG